MADVKVGTENFVERWQKIILFPALDTVQKYKLKFAFYLSVVPLFASLVLFALVLVFAKLNLYYLEGSGVIIDSQVRTAYYDQVISEITPLVGYFGILLLLTFAISWIVMSWANHPFVGAQRALGTLLNEKKRIELDQNWQTESLDFEQTVQAYIDSVASKQKPSKLDEPVVRYSLNYKFLFKFVAVYIPVCLLSSLSLRIIVESVYGKIVSLALNLLHGRTIQSHYILAQQEVIDDAQNIVLIVTVLAYTLIGRHLSHHIATMIFVFTRAMREGKFPIRLRPTDIYHRLADVLNQLHSGR